MIASFFPYADMRFAWWLLLPIAAVIMLFGNRTVNPIW